MAPRRSTPQRLIEDAVARGLVPEHWADPARAPGWWCFPCCGTGRKGSSYPTAPCGSCRRGREQGTNDWPPSTEALVLVTNLGLPNILRAEALIDQMAPGARLVWEPCPDREGLLRWALSPYAPDLAAVVAAERVGGARLDHPLRHGPMTPWPEAFPWVGLTKADALRPLWPAVRGLAAMGLHPTRFIPHEMDDSIVDLIRRTRTHVVVAVTSLAPRLALRSDDAAALAFCGAPGDVVVSAQSGLARMVVDFDAPPVALGDVPEHLRPTSHPHPHPHPHPEDT